MASGDLALAASQCKRAVKLDPTNGEARYLLGMIAATRGDHRQAIKQFKAAVEREPRSPVFHNNLGIAYCVTGQFQKAAECYKKAIEYRPDYAVAHSNLGQIYQDRGEITAAMACFREAISQSPQYVPAHVALGNLLYARGDLTDAVAHFRQALAIHDDPEIRLRLADTLDDLGHHQEAVDLYSGIAAVKPDDSRLQNNLGQALFRLGRVDEAVACYERAIALDPENSVPHNSLGIALSDLGLPREAIEHFRAALALKPNDTLAHSNLLLNINYVEDDQEKIYTQARQFETQQARKLTGGLPYFANVRTADRKLRIGYVSGDFRSHSVAYFLMPLLEAHDRERFEIFCYSNNPRQDSVTERFRSLADRWCVIRGVPDQAAADQVRSDRIDILVDLSGHSNDNRLMVFARRPAPVQVSWLGYANTSGLRAIGYRITDRVADPVGEADNLYTERLVRLPGGFLCYQNNLDDLPVSAPPELTQGYVTFGSFNMLGKVTTDVIDTWSEILRTVPDSRLILKAKSLNSEKARRYLRDQFVQRGIDAERLELLCMLSKTEHFRLYSRVDIALDTFPYNGSTTTCEALWMGVPVITLSGRCHVGRLAASILHQVGLTNFIAYDQPSYLSLAQSLAGDVELRRSLRAGQRELMQESSLMDQSAFTVRMEDCYRRMWAAWCGEKR